MNTPFLIEKVSQQLTTWTIIATIIFVLNKKKHTWLYDTLYTLGISVGILGVMLCAYNNLLLYYAKSLNISFDFTKIYCYLLLCLFISFCI